MEPTFAALTPAWFARAYTYTGSIGDFRYRFFHDDEKTLHVSVYSKVCFECADDVESKDFLWDDEGVADLKAWLQEQYEAFLANIPQA